MSDSFHLTQPAKQTVHTRQSLDALDFHDRCTNTRCRRCLEIADVLCGALNAATGVPSYDVLGRYHQWLGKQGIPAETEGGWWSREALSDANVAAFAKDQA